MGSSNLHFTLSNECKPVRLVHSEHQGRLADRNQM